MVLNVVKTTLIAVSLGLTVLRLSRIIARMCLGGRGGGVEEKRHFDIDSPLSHNTTSKPEKQNNA